MPEGPEIRLNYDLLKEQLEGEVWDGLEVVSGKYEKKPPKNYAEFLIDLPATVDSVNIRGKFIWICLDNGWTVGVGFGMTGRFSQNEDHPYIRLKVDLEDEESLYYIDTRNFGNWYFWDDISDLEKKLQELGVDLMTSNLTKDQVAKLFRTPAVNKQEITQALMSQKVIAGVGNYLKSESLYRAKIWPFAKVSDLSDDDLYDLYYELQVVAQEAYATQSEWINAGQERPYDDFQALMQVYNKKHDPLGHTVIKNNDTKDKRTTHWVPEVQTIGQPKPKPGPKSGSKSKGTSKSASKNASRRSSKSK